MRCIYSLEGSTNYGRKDRISSEVTEEHVGNLNQPLSRRILEMARRLHALSERSLYITKVSVPNSCLQKIRHREEESSNGNLG